MKIKQYWKKKLAFLCVCIRVLSKVKAEIYRATIFVHHKKKWIVNRIEKRWIDLRNIIDNNKKNECGLGIDNCKLNILIHQPFFFFKYHFAIAWVKIFLGACKKSTKHFIHINRYFSFKRWFSLYILFSIEIVPLKTISYSVACFYCCWGE